LKKKIAFTLLVLLLLQLLGACNSQQGDAKGKKEQLVGEMQELEKALEEALEIVRNTKLVGGLQEQLEKGVGQLGQYVSELSKELEEKIETLDADQINEMIEKAKQLKKAIDDFRLGVQKRQ